MCEIEDAERWIELAKLQIENNEKEKARTSYLEAASIFVLQAELQKNDHLIKHANANYKKAKEAIGQEWNQELTKQELARRTLYELHNNHHEEELCAMKKA